MDQSLPSKDEKPNEEPVKPEIETGLEDGKKPPIQQEYSIKEIRDLMMVAKGGDPEAQSLLQEIFKIDFVQEKSNFPTAINQQKQTYLMMCGDFFGKIFGEPFRKMALYDAISWRGYKGFNYEGNVEMLKKGTDLGGLIVGPQMPSPLAPQKKSRFSRNKPQGEQLEG